MARLKKPKPVPSTDASLPNDVFFAIAAFRELVKTDPKPRFAVRNLAMNGDVISFIDYVDDTGTIHCVNRLFKDLLQTDPDNPLRFHNCNHGIIGQETFYTTATSINPFLQGILIGLFGSAKLYTVG